MAIEAPMTTAGIASASQFQTNIDPKEKLQLDSSSDSNKNISDVEQVKRAGQSERVQGNQVDVAKGKPQEQATIQREQLEKMAQKLQDFVGSLNKGLEFSVDEDSGRDVIKVIDRESREVIRQYPSEEVLDLISNLSDAAGNLINSKA